MEYYEEDALAETLKEMIEIDKDIEERKNRLALKHDFNLTDLYAIFDRENHGYFNMREFSEVCDLYRLWLPHEYQKLAFRNLDRDLDQKITLKEFLFGFSPKDKNYRDVLLSRDSYSSGTKFSRLETFTPETVRDTMGLIKGMVDAEI